MRHKIKLFLIMIISMFPLLSYALQSNITAIKVIEKNRSTQIIFKLSQPTKLRAFTLTNPNRIVLDFESTHLSVNCKKYQFQNKDILSMREGYPKANLLRIVLDMNHSLPFKNLSNKNSKEVIIEISKKNEVAAVSAKKIPPLIVVIDPGHGGKDPGAIGERGTKEKDVVFAIAKNLEKIINQQPNMRAVLTRNGDYYMTLRERLMAARKHKADLFIAIHADSYFNNSARGASIYSLSRRGASTVAARWLAERENHSELGGVDLGELQDQSYLLRSVLIDLAQTSTTKESLSWGSSLLESLNEVTKLHYSRVEQAPFMVLKSPDIPSLLVETGFISNVKEEIRLSDKKHQQKLAVAIFNGIRSYQKKSLGSFVGNSLD